ncbi:hypothetical protein M422DRAFT_152016 [Sphaerobolus stellatus SS14]|nr:hypothetical protein M422DRAFT_152016 [Sphaerobolus stellatus SS14]
MPPPRVVDYSDDSDDEPDIGSDIETNVLLGIPDGEIENPVDAADPSVSRIGGHPAFLTTLPLDPSSAHCKSCSKPMPLLVQMWCPFEGSALDRGLYVWGCERGECQKKEGSIRAWRALKYNAKYASKLEKKKAREAEKQARLEAEKKKLEEEKKKQSVNPFSVSSGAPKQMAFGIGSQLFGATEEPDNESDVPEPPPSDTEAEDEEDEEDESSDETKESIMEGAEASPEWKTHPAYKPVYLSTESEYIPPAPKTKARPEKLLDSEVDVGDKKEQDWGMEGWEQSEDLDSTFDRFTKRVSSEPEQCVRYDLRGAPLPFGSRDKVYDRLFPQLPVPFTTKPGYAPPPPPRTYQASSVDKCGKCGSPRVFECQLMPNLINVLRVQDKTKETKAEEGSLEEEERRKALLSSAGMGWGTVFVFSCSKDCCDGEESWREELALVQWDD